MQSITDNDIKSFLESHLPKKYLEHWVGINKTSYANL